MQTSAKAIGSLSVTFLFSQWIQIEKYKVSIFIETAIWQCCFATKYPHTVIIFQAIGECKPPTRLDHYQNLIAYSFYHPKPLHKIWSQSIHNLWVILLTDGETERQTNKHYQKHNLFLVEITALCTIVRKENRFVCLKPCRELFLFVWRQSIARETCKTWR